MPKLLGIRTEWSLHFILKFVKLSNQLIFAAITIFSAIHIKSIFSYLTLKECWLFLKIKVALKGLTISHGKQFPAICYRV